MRVTSRFGVFAFIIAVSFLGFGASGQTLHFDANLDPFQEVPPHNTPAYGSADFSLDNNPASLTYGQLSVDAGTGVYASLLGGALSVVIGDAAPGANGPTLLILTLDTPGATTGTFSGSGAPTLLTAAQINDLNAGNLYVNIRDNVFPSGELRGQLTGVPEPGSLALLGIAGLLGLRRRSRSNLTLLPHFQK